MPFKMLPGKFYRMPVNFGQSLGPRQRGSDQVLFSEHGPKATNIAVYFRTNPHARDRAQRRMKMGLLQ